MSNKDWIGDTNSVVKTLGASNHTEEERESLDYYATEPKAAKFLLSLEKFEGKIWECACGELHLSNVMKDAGFEVYSTDIIKRHKDQDDVINFLEYEDKTDCNIITNPPYKYANQFIIKAMDIMEDGKKLALFLPIRYLEGKARKKIFQKYPPKKIYISSSRIKCAKNGEFEKMTGSAVSYAWFIWEKGFVGNPIIDWFN